MLNTNLNKAFGDIYKIAKKFIKDVGGELSFQSVKQYCERCGFKVLLYGRDASVNDALAALKISLPEYEKGIIYDNNNNRYIFINDKLDAFAMLETLLHEVGHMILKHKISKYRNEVRECEAKAFALCVLRLM